ncbi:MAG: metal-sensitive transcriptional regulator [Rickettsiales bacterium]|nr:metal-sensitive transcriptional regulator [Rickettsiales bacterium]
MAKSKKETKKDKQRSEVTVIDHSDEVKRLNRIIGQLEGIRKMLENGRKLDAFLIQCKAIHSALKSIESRVLRSHLELALDDIAKNEKKKNRAEKVAQLEELFKQAS